jgi:hypothetical protein
MTSVVGILNKRGAAIAADSAVTRRRYKGGSRNEKVTKNGNKMVRLSDVDPITVMITGNADFLGVPWDVIIRRYRQQNGTVHQPTVEAAARSLFEYIASNAVFWSDSMCGGFLSYLADELFKRATHNMFDEDERNRDGFLKRPAAFRKAFIRNVSSIARRYAREGSCPQFEGYSLEEFRQSASAVLDDFFEEKDCTFNNGFRRKGYPMEILNEIRPSFEQALLTMLSSRLNELDPSATLVFTGYGTDQQYPSLVSAVVCEGYAYRVNYSIRPQDVICISDKRPVAICPFAQKDVIKSILRGIHISWSDSATDGLQSLTDAPNMSVFEPFEGEKDPGFDFMSMLNDVEVEDLYRTFTKEGIRMLDANQHSWEKALENYDLEAMASLADSLIDLTGFQRILTFSQEGVGGLVDLAVISRNEGFTWLRRKSWYHKDVGGKDGSFGI